MRTASSLLRVAGFVLVSLPATIASAAADLSVVLEDSPDPVLVGESLTLQLTVANAGPGDAPSALVTLALPAGATFQSASSPGGWACSTPAVGGTGEVTCSRATLSSGASESFTFVVSAPAEPGTLVTTATVGTADSDPVSANDSATAMTAVVTSVESDAGEDAGTEDGGLDAGATEDAGVGEDGGMDAGTPEDAGVADAGTEGEAPPAGGCGCAGASGGGTVLGAALAVLLLASGRRRRHRAHRGRP